MAKNRHPLLTVLQGVTSSSSSSTPTSCCSRQRSVSVRSSHIIHLLSLVSYVIIILLLLLLFVRFSQSTVVVDAIGPKYITKSPSTQQQQQQAQQSTLRSKRTKHRPTTHPWIIQQRSAIGGALQQQQPTTRQFLDQCVSFMDMFEVILIRGGGGSSSSSSNRNDPSSDNDWSNVKNNNQFYHQPNQYDDRNANDNDDDDDYHYSSSNNQPSLPQRRRSDTQKNGIGSTSFGSLPNVLQKVDRKTGLMLLVSGISLTFLGITLFFNKTIIRLGHLLCIAGILLSMGLSQTIQYFVQPEKLRATICLGIGVFLVFIGSPLFGIVLEVFGILNLFGNMFPIVMIMIKQMPIIGTMLKSTNNNNNNNRSRRNNNNNDDEYYYNNDSRRQSQQPSSSRNQYDYDNRDEYGQDEDDGLGRRY